MVTIALIIGFVLIFIYRDELGGQGLGTASGSGEATDYGEPFTYETGSMQVYSAAGDSLAVASTGGIQLMDPSGRIVMRQIISMGAPAISACKKYAAFFDVGGTQLRVADISGELHKLDTENPIISVTMNSSGYMAVITQEPGYKGEIIVYNSDVNPIYKWSSGSKTILKACVAEDNKTMAVLGIDGQWGYVDTYSLTVDSTEPEDSFYASEELFFDIRYLSSGNIITISEDRLIILGNSLEIKGEYDYTGLYISDYELGSDFSVLALSRQRSGSGGSLVCIDSMANVLGEMETTREVSGISLSDKSFITLYPDSIVKYSKALEELSEKQDILGVRRAICRDSGDVALMMPNAVEIVDLRG